MHTVLTKQMRYCPACAETHWLELVTFESTIEKNGVVNTFTEHQYYCPIQDIYINDGQLLQNNYINYVRARTELDKELKER